MDKTVTYTTKSYWQAYWNKKKLIKFISNNYPFSNILKKYIKHKKYHTFIEIGGFPGYFAIFCKKYLNLESTLLDYYIYKPVLKTLLKKNNLSLDSIVLIEQDFLNFKSSKKYDVVFSFGFLEHFEDTKLVIKKHWKLVAHDGTLLIVIPNFLGFNGCLQLLADPQNLSKHNLMSMDVNVLKNIIRDLEPSSWEVFYYGGLGLWLEQLESRKLITKLVVYISYLLGKILNFFHINTKLTSPYIVIMATK